MEGPSDLPDPSPDFPGPVVTEGEPGQAEGSEALPEQVRYLVSPGDKVYVHPQGAAIIVTPSGEVTKYGPDGKPKKTSASAAKLAVGHGQWEPVAYSKPAKSPVPTEPDMDAKPITDYTPAQAVVVAKAPEPEIKSAPAPAGKHRVPMNFNEVEVTEVPKYVDDDDFLFQQKIDGIRGQLVIEPGQKPWFRSKSGDRLVSSTASKITTPMLKSLGGQSDYDGPSYTVDGELLDGKWYVFDLVTDGGEKLPWEQREAMVRTWVNEMHKAGLTQIQVLPTARTPEEKQALWDAVNTSGAEGVMIKRRDAPYNYGARVNHTLKAKITSTADVYVLERDRDGKENAVIGVKVDGVMTEIGTVSMQGKEKGSTKVNVGDVIEVEYLWAMPGSNKLQQPRMKKKRPDKTQDDAVSDQFRFVSKDVVDLEASQPELVPEEPAEPAPAASEVDPVDAAIASMAVPKAGGYHQEVSGDPRSDEFTIQRFKPTGPDGEPMLVSRDPLGNYTYIFTDYKGKQTEQPLSQGYPELWKALMGDSPRSYDGMNPDDLYKWSKAQLEDARADTEMPRRPLLNEYGAYKPSNSQRSAHYRASAAWQVEFQKRLKQGPPTVETRIADPASASDEDLEAELERLNSAARVANAPAEEVQDLGTRKALDNWDNYRSAMADDELKRVTSAAEPLRQEMLRRLRESAPPAEDPDFEYERWAGAPAPEMEDPPGGVLGDEATLEKIRNMYVVNDKSTIDKNADLRSGSPSAAAKNWRGKVNRWVKSSVAEEDSVVHRGIAVNAEMVRSLRPGAVITDPGIMSTDEVLDSAEGYLDTRYKQRPNSAKVMLEILVPAGHPIVDAGYGEWVLPSNTAMTVRKVSIDDDGTYRLAVELGTQPG